MKNKTLFISILLAGLVGMNYSSAKEDFSKLDNDLLVRGVLRQNEAVDTGDLLTTYDAPVANNLVSNVLAQVNTPLNGKISIRFVAGIDSYTYDSARFNITLKDSLGAVVKEERSFEVSSAYLGIEVEGEVKYAADVFGEGYNYLIAYTLTDVPEDYWNYQFDVTASVGNEGNSASVATKRITDFYNVKVNVYNVDGTKIETKYEKVDIDTLYTVYAPSYDGLVASHDYVKGYLSSGEMATHNVYYSELDKWDGSSVSASFSGEGTEENPYLISSAADFALLRENTAAGTTYEGTYFKMTKSIDFDGANFMISTFAGNFDGNNCSVRGLAIENTAANTGLFANLTAGEVKNVSTYGKILGAGITGSIVGLSNGLVNNCTNYAEVKRNGQSGGIVGKATASIDNCVNYGNCLKNASGWNVGGIVGESTASVNYSKNFGDVQGVSTHIGGVVGSTTSSVSYSENYGKVYGASWGGAGIVANMGASTFIDNCTNYGSVDGTGQLGGIVGKTQGQITNCVNNGNVTGSGSSVGGIAGSDLATVVVKNCVNNGAVKGTTTIGGIMGRARGTFDNCTNNGNVTGNVVSKSYVAGIIGLTSGETAAGKSLQLDINKCTNTGEITGGQYAAGIIGLTYRGDITNCTNKGTINGTNTVAGIVAAMGWTSDGSSGVYRNKIDNCENYGAVKNSEYFGAGIIATVNYCDVTNCTNYGRIGGSGDNMGGITSALYGTATVSSCTNNGEIVGKTNIGGITAQLDGGAISNCKNNGTVTATNEGGLSGDIYGKVTAKQGTVDGVVQAATA